jgi:Lipocalin-like domain
MKEISFLLLLLIIACVASSQNPVGRWKKISEVSSYGGQTFDSYKALLTQRPCAADIVWEINADQTFRLNASASGCAESYKKMQEKLYSKTNWRVQGNKITISTLKDFAVGQTYIMSILGNKMTWVGTEGQGTITYQKLYND